MTNAKRRLVSNSVRNNETNCLIWNRYSQNGYGKTSFCNKSIYTHRLSYMMFNNNGEPIPDRDEDGARIIVRHMCNNSLCIEPSHLKLGTQYQNDYDDKILHGTLIRGEKHHNCSINKDKAIDIKLSLRDKNDPLYETVSMRAKKFGVSYKVVKCIDTGRSWAHIPNRNGITSSHRKLDARLKRKIAKDKIWTKKEYDIAKLKIMKNSTSLYLKKTTDVRGPCWVWNKSKYKNDYGRISIFGKCCGVHIIACEIRYGRHRNEGEVTRHMCANKVCCNPNHLLFGTTFDNSMDTIRHNKQ